jgi:hypothetical protein
MLKATLVLEYLHRVDTLVVATDDHIQSNILLPGDKTADAAAKFLDSHSGMLYTKELRAICAIGIAVGVIIKAQLRYMNSDSFISRLNRLEMDYIRLIDLYRQA